VDTLSILTLFERGIPNDDKDGQRISTKLTYSFLRQEFHTQPVKQEDFHLFMKTLIERNHST